VAQIVLGTLAEEIHDTDEKHLGMATALGDSDPGHLLSVEVRVNGGVRIGSLRDTAQELMIQTTLGSTGTFERTDKHLADFRNMVTSPGNNKFFSWKEKDSVLSFSRLWRLPIQKLNAFKALGVV